MPKLETTQLTRGEVVTLLSSIVEGVKDGSLQVTAKSITQASERLSDKRKRDLTCFDQSIITLKVDGPQGSMYRLMQSLETS